MVAYLYNKILYRRLNEWTRSIKSQIHVKWKAKHIQLIDVYRMMLYIWSLTTYKEII